MIIILITCITQEANFWGYFETPKNLAPDKLFILSQYISIPSLH